MNKFLRTTPYYQRKRRLRPSPEALDAYLRDLVAAPTHSSEQANKEILQNQAIAFENLKQMNRAAVPHLLPIMNHPLAQAIIRSFGFYVVDVLIESLDTHPEHTESALFLLSEIGDKHAKPAAQRYLNHDNLAVRRYARQIVEQYRTVPQMGDLMVYWLRTIIRRFGLTIW